MTTTTARGGGVNNWSNLPTDSTKKLPTWAGKGGVENPEKCQHSLGEAL